MKKLLFLFVIALLISVGTFGQVFSNHRNDTIQPIPFTETWDSASFTANGWRFPWMQGNWTIFANEGNPKPCAAFTGTPSQLNYSYTLVSPWFDATDLTCDMIYLDFDVSLSSLWQTGTERLTVILEYDTVELTLMILTNDSSFSWTHLQYHLYGLLGEYFRIRFIASGTDAGRISQWELDNIAITRRCLPPEVQDGYPEGPCYSSTRDCLVYLSWSAPECPLIAEELWFIYDDDSWEEGLTGQPGYTVWLGNLFPINPPITGMMEGIWVYFIGDGSTSSQTLFIELFDTSGNSLGAPVPFLADFPFTWKYIPLPGILFTGPIYAMVLYDSLPGKGHYMGIDLTGPYTSQKLAYYYDGTTWANLPYWSGSAVFLVRGYAMVETDQSEKKKVIVTSEGIVDEQIPPEKGLDRLGMHESTPAKWSTQALKNYTDSSTVIGYNVYRKQIWFVPDTAFIKINPTPISGTTYIDSIHCAARYYITAVYNNGCESEPSENTGDAGCYIGIPESNRSDLKISPNPANNWVEVISAARIEGISLYDMTGRKHYSLETPGTFNLRIDLPGLAEGLYILKVTTEKGTVASRIMILY